MKLYNTLTRSVDELEPHGTNVGMYLCGVTVYDESHIGHARTIVVFDVLRRYLISKGLKVRFVQNFTDVDDKIINRAKAEGRLAAEISARYIASYYRDFERLNVLHADLYPRATEHIGDMVRLIQGLVENGKAYVALNGVYFRVRSFPGYGKLSKKPVEELESGARIEIDASKEDPLDFALWKFSSEDPSWESPWGRGRPGWHIECSAMALKYLGETFDIHGGGHDLVFPHHENEIAQSESYTGKQFAKFWVHSGMVTINSQKMSKSLGNIVRIEQAIDRWGMNAIRLYCLSTHYAKPLDYTNELLQESAQRWRQLETCWYELRSANGAGGRVDDAAAAAREAWNSFSAAMEDDLNTSLAITALMKLAKSLNEFAASDSLSEDMARSAMPAFERMAWIFGLKPVLLEEKEVAEIESMVRARNQLRSEKKFKEADEIRKQLLARSVELMDHKGRTVWKKVERPEQQVNNKK